MMMMIDCGVMGIKFNVGITVVLPLLRSSKDESNYVGFESIQSLLMLP